MNFVGRAEIIESIQSRIAMNQMSLCVVYGPHRSGKSYVASQLVRRHKALYLAGRMANEAIHVADMNRALEARFVPTDEQDKFEPITSLQEAFEGLFESSVKTPQTVVIDDYPSLVEAVPQFPIHLRDLLDTYKETSQLNIILMANGLEQLDGRIIGDRSLIGPYVSEYFEVKPFSLVDMKSLGLHYAKDDLRTVFAVTGGLPAYVQYFDNGESIDTNIINLFFSVSGALFEETQHILHRDMKNIT
ncbi:MAG: AAA family ATPase, partial [Veillonella sp.]